MLRRKIDIHTHILPPELPKWKEKFGYGGFIEIQHLHAQCAGQCSANMLYDDGRFFRKIESNCWDPQTRIAECDQHGVGAQVISTVPVMFNYWAKPEHAYDTSRFLNDHVAQVVAEHPTRFIGLGTLPMQSAELSVRELERCVRELGLVGIQIGSHIGDWNLDDRNLHPVYEAAERLGAAIFVHPWDMMGKEKMPKYWLPWLVGMPAEVSLAICSMIFGGIFEKFPRLRVAFAHGGGAFPATLGRIEHGFQVRPDLCAVDNDVNPRDYIGRFYVDSLVHDPRALQFILDVLGDKHIALGTDHPFPLGELEPGKLIESLPGISQTTRERLLWGNALDWLAKPDFYEKRESR